MPFASKLLTKQFKKTFCAKYLIAIYSVQLLVMEQVVCSTNLISTIHFDISTLFWSLSDFQLGQVRLGQVRLGQVRCVQIRLGLVQVQVRLGNIRLGQVSLGLVRLGQVRLGWVWLGQVSLGQVWLDYVFFFFWCALFWLPLFFFFFNVYVIASNAYIHPAYGGIRTHDLLDVNLPP